ncbi:MAG TPA: histidinol dehydrogenase [Virgibacillus sp.]|nr:histidinol dehydrogenase [Virgibacillus sp.]
MRIITAEQYKRNERQTTIDQTLDQIVLNIIKDVQTNGDDALRKYTNMFDNVDIDELVVTKQEFEDALEMVDDNFVAAIQAAIKNITRFHDLQKEQSWFMTRENGIMLGQHVTPIEKIGIYVPGGQADYPSTVIMNVIPAKIAGVPSISLTTPPQADGTINPHVLTAARLVGIDRVYKIGGAQAIAALAYGTQSVDRVYKIVGPGNRYVARAKKWVYGDVAIDMIAGPSEICIVADESAPPSYVAADLLSQAEHDEDATAICITTDHMLAEAVRREVDEQCQSLERESIIKESLAQNGRMIVVQSLQEAFDLVNDMAPEHLQLMIKDASLHVSNIRNAGAIFIGNYSPEPLGDYYAGPNHTLPTDGTATFSSPLGVYDFIKRSSIIHYSKGALREASDDIITLARKEDLEAHAQSIQQRQRKENNI